MLRYSLILTLIGLASVLANLILESGVPVNILHADTKDIDGKAYGQIILGLPDSEKAAEKVSAYLTANEISFTKL